MEITPIKLLIILAIVILVFGTQKLRSLGSDIGSAIRDFKKALNDDKPNIPPSTPVEKTDMPTNNTDTDAR
jgi:sec-independent protein translocase protein TatA